MRNAFFALFSLVLVLAVAPGSHAAASTDAVSQFAAGLGDEAIAIAANTKLSEVARRGELEKLFSKHVDIQWIGRFVLGKHWRQATEEQKKRYLDAYQRFIIRNYTVRFSEYTNEKFRVSQVRDEGNGKYYLTTEIVRPGKENIIVDYRLKKEGDVFKIHDIVVEGVSLITTQRSEFSSVVAREGIDHLIEQLNSRNTEGALAAAPAKPATATR